MTPGPSMAILLTPAGAGAIAVIRLVGPLNSNFAKKHLTRALKVGRCVHSDVIDGDQVLDDVVAVLNDDGAVDLNVHAGPWVIESIFRLAERFGYRRQDWRQAPGQSLDAADDIERQVRLDLPAARSKPILRLLTAQPAAWREMMLNRDVAEMRQALADTALGVALRVPTVAIVGPPNVGKSTLANALFGQARSITADLPGTTRDWVGALADMNGLVVRLVDTPGIRQTPDAIEAAAIRQAQGVMTDADLVIAVIDGSRPVDAAEQAVLNEVRGRNPMLVRSKADLGSHAELGEDALPVSAVSGDGLDALRTHIIGRLGASDLTSPHARCWTDGQRYKLRTLLESAPASI